MRISLALLALGMVAGLVWMLGRGSAAPAGDPLEPGFGHESAADGEDAIAARGPRIDRTQMASAAAPDAMDGDRESSGAPEARSAAELLESLGLKPGLIVRFRPGPAGPDQYSGLGDLRRAMIGSGASQQELFSALLDPAATPQEKSLLLLASTWAEDDCSQSITEFVEPVDFSTLASLEHDDPRMQYEFAKAVTLERLGEPGAADFLLGGLDRAQALSSAQGNTAEGHLVKQLLLAATDQDAAALGIARSMIGDGADGIGDDVAWAAIASADPAEAVGSALALNPWARDGLILAAHSMGENGNARALTSLLAVEVTDGGSGHFAGRGTRALLAGADASMIDDFFWVVDNAPNLKATWMKRGVLSAKSCTALGDVLARTALDSELNAGPVEAADFLGLARRVEQRLNGGDMSRYEERATLQSVADSIRSLPRASKQRRIGLRMLSRSMDSGHRSLAKELADSK